MEPYRPLRLGLFAYECFRLLFLVAIFAGLRPGDGASFPWLVYAAPNALFPLMAFFLWLSLTRYGAYLPLFLAGKFISLFSIIGWSLFLQRSIKFAEMSGYSGYPAADGDPVISVIPVVFAGVLLCSDTFAAAAVYFIIKKVNNTEKAIQTSVHGGE